MKLEPHVPFDDDDPRFVELVAYLCAIKRTGRNSPIPRIVAEWALLGFLVTTGKIAIGGDGMDYRAMQLPKDVLSPDELAAAQQSVDADLSDLFG